MKKEKIITGILSLIYLLFSIALLSMSIWHGISTVCYYDYYDYIRCLGNKEPNHFCRVFHIWYEGTEERVVHNWDFRETEPIMSLNTSGLIMMGSDLK